MSIKEEKSAIGIHILRDFTVSNAREGGRVGILTNFLTEKTLLNILFHYYFFQSFPVKFSLKISSEFSFEKLPSMILKKYFVLSCSAFPLSIV